MPEPEIDINGDEVWRNANGQYHRTDGHPAVVGPNDGYRAWYKNGKLHRLDGPAVIRGMEFHRREYWYINGKQIKPIPDIILELSKRLDDNEV